MYNRHLWRLYIDKNRYFAIKITEKAGEPGLR